MTTSLYSKQPEFEHTFDGTRWHDSASYEGRVFVCSCGEPFMDTTELYEHIKESMPEPSTDGMDADIFQSYLAAAHSLLFVSLRDLPSPALRQFEIDRERDAVSGHRY